jgi:hypothetical protein
MKMRWMVVAAMALMSSACGITTVEVTVHRPGSVEEEAEGR